MANGKNDSKALDMEALEKVTGGFGGILDDNGNLINETEYELQQSIKGQNTTDPASLKL